jgi:hypothetical protein
MSYTVLDPNQTAFAVRSDGILHLKNHRMIDARVRPYLNDPLPHDLNELRPYTTLIPLADVPVIVEGTIEFLQRVRPDWLQEMDINDPNTFFPVRDHCSVTGQPPATHAFCFWRNFTDRLWDELAAWRDSRVPNFPHDVRRWPAGTTKEAALAALGMKLVAPWPAAVTT